MLFNNSSAPSGAMYTNFMSSVSPAYLQIGVPTAVNITTGFAPGYTYQYAGYVKMYIDYNRNGDFTDAGEEVFGGASQCSSNVVGDFTIPPYVQSGVTALRVVNEMFGTSTSVFPCGTYSYGETEDYLVQIAPRIPKDAGVEAIITPTTFVANASNPLEVRVRNYGLDTIQSVNISYILNNGAVNSFNYNLAPINPMDSVDIVLANITLAMGANIIKAYTVLQGDSNYMNDTTIRISYLQAVANLPYNDGFETSNLWMPDTLLNQWQLGVPQMPNITTAHSPVNVWGIDLDSTYANNSYDYLYTPIFVIPSTADSAYLKFWHIYDTQSGSDGGFVQFRVNGGNWSSLGYQNDPDATNWYTHNAGGTEMWSGNQTWIQSGYFLDFVSTGSQFVGAGTIQFRFVFVSNATTNNYSGWAIDDFSITLPQAAIDAGVSTIVTPVGSSQIGANVTVSVEVTNYGSSPQASIPVNYSVNGGTAVTETFLPAGGGLQANASAVYTFNTTFVSPGINYNLCSWTALANDAYPQNDNVCSAITVTAAGIDAGVISVLADPSWHDTTKITPATIVRVKFVNYGLNSLTSVPLQYQVGPNTVSEVWAGVANYGDTIDYAFTTTYSSPVGNYQLCAKTNVTNDANATNDSKCKGYFGIIDIGVGETDEQIFTVNQNEPNPAYGAVGISYSIPQSGKVKFELHNALGQLVMEQQENKVAGNHRIELEASQLSNGIYYYTVEFDNQRITHKMVVNQ
jgi:hypothetical protein